jgi:hypothetical protein
MPKTFFIFFLSLFLIPSLSWANSLDTDNDGLSNQDEINIYYTDPSNVDTDGDGYNDGLEIQNKYSPLLSQATKLVDADTDNDGLNDLWEIIIGTSLNDPDSDNDSYNDWDEVYAGYDPLNSKPQIIAKIIEVDLKQQILRYTFNGRILDQFHISSGIAGMETPLGEFRVLDKVPLKNYGGSGYNFYYPNTKWNLHFTTGYARYYIHGAYWHNNFGHPMSHGCVNVAYWNMENLYHWANVGTRVVIY